MKVTLVKLSICSCGFPVLAENIGLGTEYQIDETNRTRLTMICGGCSSRLSNLDCVMVESRHGGRPGFLPREIFSN